MQISRVVLALLLTSIIIGCSPTVVRADDIEEVGRQAGVDVFGGCLAYVKVQSCGYDPNTRKITIHLTNDTDRLDMTGLGVIELLFNASTAPTAFSAYIQFGNDTSSRLNMLINVTIRPIQFYMLKNQTYTDAKYLLAYIHLFASKDIVNEHNPGLVFNGTHVGGPLDDTGINRTGGIYTFDNNFILSSVPASSGNPVRAALEFLGTVIPIDFTDPLTVFLITFGSGVTVGAVVLLILKRSRRPA